MGLGGQGARRGGHATSHAVGAVAVELFTATVVIHNVYTSSHRAVRQVPRGTAYERDLSELRGSGGEHRAVAGDDPGAAAKTSTNGAGAGGESALEWAGCGIAAGGSGVAWISTRAGG